ncbi:hypothetical protein N0B31_07560 [Salinirubellus salinus]|uniref:Uncharacterized protein n=1 Tax=Salinirubellus salinus TaxID=1364945 RepID=A0A9E7R6K3_9EURY|nr:hypothetical protein [Salinirubellus salinus]UWM56139.1 hypothetical protein N0B31_07560 [Salinirubellus salinus]
MSDDGIDPRPPVIGFLLAALGVVVAGVYGGNSIGAMLPVAVLFGALFAFGMLLSQWFGRRD